MDNKKVEMGECLVIIGKLFTKPGNKQLIRTARQLTHKQAILHHNDYEYITREIAHISFPNLTVLQLSYNKIRSIEALQHFQMPQLQNLHLSFNDLQEVRTLRKCQFTKLEKLSLMGTKTIDFQCFSGFYFPKLQNLILEDQKNKNDFRCDNIGLFAKFLNKIDKTIAMKEERKAKVVVEMIRQRI